MKDYDSDDSLALKDINDCRTLIHTIGCILLFPNVIHGFSVEEHMPASAWWTEDPETYPWAWRITLAEDEANTISPYRGTETEIEKLSSRKRLGGTRPGAGSFRRIQCAPGLCF